ncbi:MAG: ribosome silencing factor [Wolinella sp.]
MREVIIQKIVEILDSKKGENIEVFELKGSDYLVDYVVIATALADKHATALLDALKSELKPLGESFYATEESDDWIVADLGDIMIHLFTEAHRKKFNLEEFLAGIQKGSNTR